MEKRGKKKRPKFPGGVGEEMRFWTRGWVLGRRVCQVKLCAPPGKNVTRKKRPICKEKGVVEKKIQKSKGKKKCPKRQRTKRKGAKGQGGVGGNAPCQ